MPLPPALSLVCMDDALIGEAHAAWLGRGEPTDVLSFRYPAPPGGEEAGEVLVNVQRAVQEGVRRGDGPDRELALYIVHGLHHLVGADDDTPARRRAMLRQEERWLDQAARAPVWDRILEPAGGS